jgi:hypothetical protein
MNLHCFLVTVVFLFGFGRVSASDLAEIALPANATDIQVRAYLTAIDWNLQHGENSISTPSQFITVRDDTPQLVAELRAKLEVVPTAHLETLCRIALTCHDRRLSVAIVASLISPSRTDYAPAQKETLLKHLPKLTALIVVLDRLNWFEGAHAALAAGWKDAKKNFRLDGALDTTGTRYAQITAREGLTDALVALARTVKIRMTTNPNPAEIRALHEEHALLQKLVPVSLEGRALTDFIVKNRDRLVYDSTTKTYSTKL